MFDSFSLIVDIRAVSKLFAKAMRVCKPVHAMLAQGRPAVIHWNQELQHPYERCLTIACKVVCLSLQVPCSRRGRWATRNFVRHRKKKESSTLRPQLNRMDCAVITTCRAQAGRANGKTLELTNSPCHLVPDPLSALRGPWAWSGSHQLSPPRALPFCPCLSLEGECQRVSKPSYEDPDELQVTAALVKAMSCGFHGEVYGSAYPCVQVRAL